MTILPQSGGVQLFRQGIWNRTPIRPPNAPNHWFCPLLPVFNRRPSCVTVWSKVFRRSKIFHRTQWFYISQFPSRCMKERPPHTHTSCIYDRIDKKTLQEVAFFYLFRGTSWQTLFFLLWSHTVTTLFSWLLTRKEKKCFVFFSVSY